MGDTDIMEANDKGMEEENKDENKHEKRNHKEETNKKENHSRKMVCQIQTNSLSFFPELTIRFSCCQSFPRVDFH